MEDTAQKTNRRRTQAERRDESERGLVRAAVALVSEEGVSASTFEAIARRSGYSRGLVGQRFGSKLGLIEAVIAYLHDGRESFADGGKLDGLPGLEALLTYANHYVQRLSHLGEVQAYFRLLAWAVADISTFRTVFAAEHDRIGARFEGWIRQGQAEGQIRPDLDATAAALMVGSQLLGLSIQVLIDPAMDLNPIRATYLATLRHAFSASGGE
ncbi:MAG TPA: TetR/AcrR family transcriptional regulator [Phenylobacterium sp.]|jgi:AcrR family transcriptional regulator|uniref:TetR/AcrR family transcriptional regulator n=1 Tax=Phenylobacterium sp. TaxID=1871053 RepID=UPI002CBF4140|nr:TetR/AcrR family transcriptional regulator [Phenylobacterium sp.]HXA38685.1 TetR/AcrR family transcriptional regulator [Phenylobacterium sp.]